MKLNRMLGAAMVFSLGVITSSAALANDALIGAVIGGAAGALIGNTMGGDEGMVAGGALGAAAGAAIGYQSDRHARKRARKWRDWHSRDYFRGVTIPRNTATIIRGGRVITADVRATMTRRWLSITNRRGEAIITIIATTALIAISITVNSMRTEGNA